MAASKINHKKKHVLKRELPLHMMLIPGIIFTFIFCYIPMAGMVIAFQKFIPAKGLFGDQKWIGLDNFTYLINLSLIHIYAMDLVDEFLRKDGYYFRESEKAQSLQYSCLFGDEIAGCTMVFNRKLADAVRLYEPRYITMHDGWVHRVCLSVGGTIISDKMCIRDRCRRI